MDNGMVAAAKLVMRVVRGRAEILDNWRMSAQMIWTKDLAKAQAHKASMAPGGQRS